MEVMRVISGYLGGRVFNAPPGHRTHPMSERVRGALFNALGDISGLTVLDAFAGSGALSIEAISRGAAGAIAIDIDKSAHRTLKENIESLGLKASIKAIRANASGWSDNNQQQAFDLVLAAPPYDAVQLSVCQKLTIHLKNTAVYVLDWPGKLEAPEFIGLRMINQKNYGDAQLVFYRSIS